MFQQLFSRYPADVVEHGKVGAHFALLIPPMAALLYPFLLAAFLGLEFNMLHDPVPDTWMWSRSGLE